MRRRDITTALVSSAAASAVLSRSAQAQSCTAPCYIQTPAESAIGVLPIDTQYVPGHVYRYGKNTTPGTIDMTQAINTAANVCRKGNYPLQLPGETMLVWSTLDFSGIYVMGLGSPFGGASLIQAPPPNTPVPQGSPYTTANFDIISTKGESTFYNFNVDGGNSNIQAGVTGDNFSLKAPATTHPYLISFINVGSTNAKRNGCYIERGGYTSFFHFHCLNAGLHGLQCVGTSTDMCTTIRDYGSSQFSGTPHGFGISLTECASCAFRDSILEQTGGIQLNGVNNRAITFDGVYQENASYPPAYPFITDNGSLGIGLVVQGCFAAGGGTVPALSGWQQVFFEGNAGLAIPTGNRFFQGDGGQQFASATADVTAASMTLNPGTYLIFGTVQSIVNSGTGNITQLACNITTNSTGPGTANSTNGSFIPGADQQTYTPSSGISDLRVNCSTWMQFTSTTTIYLRSHIALSGSVTVGYHGMLNAVLIQ